jgi:hypothetical protein
LTPRSLVAQDHQRALEAVSQVGLLHRRAVHLRVGPDGGDELGDATRRLLHLGEQGGGGERARHPLQTGLEARSLQDACGPLTPGDVDAGGGERRRDGPLAFDAVPGEPRRERLLAVRADEGVRVCSQGLDLATQLVERGQLGRRDVVVGETAQR